MTYVYRVFIETENASTDAMHYAGEKLYEGAIFRVNKPETQIHGRPVIVYRVDNHPGDDTPGVAHARTQEAQAQQERLRELRRPRAVARRPSPQP